MSDGIASVGVAEIGVVLLMLERAAAIWRAFRGKSNGHARVRPQDAIEFYDLQKGTDAIVRELLRVAEKDAEVQEIIRDRLHGIDNRLQAQIGLLEMIDRGVQEARQHRGG